MAFHRKDEARLGADKPLSTALLQDLDDSADAAWAGRGRRATWSFDARNRPRWCGLDRVGLPILWPASYGCKEVKVTIWGTIQGEDVSVGLYARRADDLARQITEPPAVAGSTLSPSGSRQSVTLTLGADVLGARAWSPRAQDREYLLLPYLESSEDAGTPIGHAASGWDRWAVDFPSSAALPDSIPPAVLRMARTPSSGGAAVATPDGYPALGQILRTESSADKIYTYPPPGVQYDSVLGTSYNDDGTIHVLGNFLIDAIEVRESAFYDLPSRGYSLNAGQYPAAQAARRIYAKSRKTFASRTNIYRLGPSRALEDALQQDQSAAALGTNAGSPAAGVWYAGTVGSGYGPMNQTRPEYKIASAIFDPEDPGAGTYEELSWATFQRPRTFLDEDSGSTGRATYTRTLALVSVSTYSEGGSYGVRLRQTRPTAAETGTYQEVTCEAARHINDNPYADLAGYLLHWVAQPDSGTIAPQRLHPLRGFIPIPLFHLYRLQLVRLDDVWASHSLTDTKLAVEASVSDRPLEGGPRTADATDRLLHLHALTVLEGEGTDPAAIGGW
jgi:hypothetical protein